MPNDPSNAMIGGLELMHMNVPVDKLLCETRRVFQALGEAADEALATHGLSARERVLLRMLARENGPVSVATLARTTLTPVKDATLALETLRSAGWLDWRGDSPDARRPRSR